MKHKKLLFLLLTFFAIYFIYRFAATNQITYIALGDSFALGENPYGEVAYGYSDYLADYFRQNQQLKFYTKKFATVDARIKDVYQDVLLNKKVYVEGKSVGLKSSLREANLITLSIGANDLFNQVNIFESILSEDKITSTIEKMKTELKRLVKELKKYNKNIILVGYYNFYPQKKDYDFIFQKVDAMYQNLANDENIIYVSLFDNFNSKQYLSNPFDIHPSILGYESIYQKILRRLPEDIFKDEKEKKIKFSVKH